MGSTPVQEDLTYLGITTPLRGDYWARALSWTSAAREAMAVRSLSTTPRKKLPLTTRENLHAAAKTQCSKKKKKVSSLPKAWLQCFPMTSEKHQFWHANICHAVSWWTTVMASSGVMTQMQLCRASHVPIARVCVEMTVFVDEAPRSPSWDCLCVSGGQIWLSSAAFLPTTAWNAVTKQVLQEWPPTHPANPCSFTHRAIMKPLLKAHCGRGCENSEIKTQESLQGYRK